MMDSSTNSWMDDSSTDSSMNSWINDSRMDFSSPLDSSPPGSLGISERHSRHCPAPSPPRPLRCPALPRRCWRTPRCAPRRRRAASFAAEAAGRSAGRDSPAPLPSRRRDCPTADTPPRGTERGTARGRDAGTEGGPMRDETETQKRGASHAKKGRSGNDGRSTEPCRLCGKRKGPMDCFWVVRLIRSCPGS